VLLLRRRFCHHGCIATTMESCTMPAYLIAEHTITDAAKFEPH
jgi:hypothetical protein